MKLLLKCRNENEWLIGSCDYGLLRTKTIGTYLLNISKITHLIRTSHF